MPRPVGAFELSSCVRRCATRSWLHALVGIAGLERAEALLTLPRQHPLTQGVEPRAWKKVLAGSDPRKVGCGASVLFLHITGVAEYAGSRLAFNHPFWREVDPDLPRQSGDEAFVGRCMLDLDVIELDPDDFSNASWLGLRDELDYFEQWPVKLDWRRCVSLDGVLAVARLLKAARRAQLAEQIRHLEDTLSSALREMARTMKMDNAAANAWYCIEEVLLTAPCWALQPDAAELKAAEDWLMRYHALPYARPTRGDTLGARRRMIAEQAIAHRRQSARLFWFRPATPLTRWLVSAREQASALVHAAIDASVGCDVAESLPGALQMPASIHRRRRPVEYGERDWEVFAKPFPDARIPIDCVPDA